ncbi:MAG: ABC transporter ATP-binding protein [Opitutales bacterium]
MNPVIQTSGLGRRFGHVVALHDVTLEIPSGQIVGLVGPNGAGKTTLFSIVCGFLKPSTGTVNVLGRSPLSPELQGRVAILPQDAPLQKGTSIKHQFAFFARLQGFSAKEASNEAERVIASVDLLEKANDGPDTLSHGMRKRASLAQAFIGKPELILLDEPTAGLDPVTTHKVRELVKKEAVDRTIVISSHNLAELQEVCDSVAILNEGKLIDFRPVSEIVDRSKTMIIRLEAQPSVDLVDAVSNLPGVTSVEAGDAQTPRLHIMMDAAIDDSEVDLAILGLLKEKGVRYREIRRGESLEEKVVEITKKDSLGE